MEKRVNTSNESTLPPCAAINIQIAEKNKKIFSVFYVKVFFLETCLVVCT